MSLWPFAGPQMWVSGVVGPVPLSRFRERNLQKRSTPLAERAVIGQSMSQLSAASWSSPEFLEELLASRRCGEDSRPCQKTAAPSRCSKYNSCPGRPCARGRKQKWMQTWKCEWQVSDLEKNNWEYSAASLLNERSFWYLTNRKSLHGRGLWLPVGGIFLVYHQGLEQKQEWSHML